VTQRASVKKLTPIATTAKAVQKGAQMPILRMPAILAEMGYRSHASVYSAIHAGLLTHPVPIGRRAVGIPSEEVQAVNAARIAGQTEQQIRELVNRLHTARCANFGEPFKPTWLERSAQQKRQAQKRAKCSARGNSVRGQS
jgi:prophage regulatory protein